MLGALMKSALREIRQSLGRYLAIFAIILLGVGVYGGLKMSQPNMMATGKEYIDDHRLFDFRLLSTLGFTREDVAAFAAGLTLRDGTVCLPAGLEPLGAGESLITVCEGKYHQVRRMMASRGMTVEYLERRQEGPLTLGDLPRGKSRELTEQEVASLEG